MADLRFDGRCALVTGAGRGVGREYARLLAQRGACVVVADSGAALDGTGPLDPAPAQEVVAAIRAAGGQAVASVGSVAEPAQARAMVETALSAFGRLDIVINNAGISDPALFEDLTLEQVRRMLDVHYLGSVHVLQAAWRHLKASGAGRVVNGCAEGMLGVHPMNVAYAASKAAVFGLTRALAVEGIAHGVGVNALCARATTRLANRETVAKVWGRRPEDIAPMAPMAPELCAPVAAYLSHESCALNGEVLVAGAGKVMRLAVAQTVGIEDPALTPEMVAEGLDQVMAMEGARVFPILLGGR
jgi:hypothetical protein